MIARRGGDPLRQSAVGSAPLIDLLHQRFESLQGTQLALRRAAAAQDQHPSGAGSQRDLFEQGPAPAPFGPGHQSTTTASPGGLQNRLLETIQGSLATDQTGLGRLATHILRSDRKADGTLRVMGSRRDPL